MSLWRKAAFVSYGLSRFTVAGYEAAVASANYVDLSKVNLRGKSYVITGANSGIGLALAKWFAQRGGTVHMVCRSEKRGQAALEEVVKSCTTSDADDASGSGSGSVSGSGGGSSSGEARKRVKLRLCDVSKPADCAKLAAEMVKNNERVDVLVNNAGTMFTPDNDVKTLHGDVGDKDSVERTLAVNTLGTVVLTEHLYEHMAKCGDDGRVINVSSGGGLLSNLTWGVSYNTTPSKWSNQVAYSRTKRHQIALAEHWAATKKTSVRFYAAHPGWASTPGVDSVPSMVQFQAFTDKVGKRWRTPQEGADCVCWLAVAPQDVIGAANNGKFFRDREVEIQHLKNISSKYSSEELDACVSWLSQRAQYDGTPLSPGGGSGSGAGGGGAAGASGGANDSGK
mmetsp:Transcript_15652/g.38744  ORF Transcript_15652/g.38744 Transcript_15652/m.38744 type:complete len:396 (-) Transcript_15652:52-1239(-)